MAMTILSAGALIEEVLTSDEDLMEICTKVFPIVAEDEAKLPYICYRRDSIQQKNIKSNIPMEGAHQATYELNIYAVKYEQGIEIAEMAAQILDNKSACYIDGEGKITARKIHVANASEDWVGDAFLQKLIITINID